jgi:hypothetical protein
MPIAEGSKGQEVRRIQTKLKDLNLYQGAPDGIFGPQTEQAVKMFQERQGITVDGIVGGETWKQLQILNVWIFQAIPERYDLRKEEIFREGNHETWYATRYREWMTTGEVVFFWLGGVSVQERGIYGWGQLTSEPYLREGWKDFGVDLIYRRRFPTPLTEPTIKQNPVLSEMLIFKVRTGTNFLLSAEEGQALLTLCQQHDPDGPAFPALD